MLRAIAQYLLSHGYTTYSLASAIGVSQPTVSRLASGRRTNINAEAALNLITFAGGRVTFPAEVERLVRLDDGVRELIGTDGAPDVPVQPAAQEAA